MPCACTFQSASGGGVGRWVVGVKGARRQLTCNVMVYGKRRVAVIFVQSLPRVG